MNLAISKINLQQAARFLGRVAHIWLNPSHPLRQEAIQALQVSTGFTVSMITQAIVAAFEELTEQKITDYIASEPAFTKDSQAPDHVLHILAGNVFTAWLPGAATTLLLGADCTLKPSSQEKVFAPLWKRSVEESDPVLGQHIHVTAWEEGLLSRYPAIVAYGSDETLSALQAQIPSRVRFVGYGHKFSVGILWKKALEQENSARLSEDLRKDIEPFNLQGCLSPKIIYVEGDPGRLERLLSGVPVMPKIRSFESWAVLKTELRSFVPHLSTLGMAGSKGPVSQKDLDELGISRVCALGEMQHPPLTWRNGGFSLLEALTS